MYDSRLYSQDVGAQAQYVLIGGGLMFLFPACLQAGHKFYVLRPCQAKKMCNAFSVHHKPSEFFP